MAIFPTSSFLLYLVCSRKEVQLYSEVFKEKDFKPSSHLQASSWVDDAEQEPLWQDQPFLSHAVSTAVELSSVRRQASRQLFTLDETSPVLHVPFSPCSDLYSTLLSVQLEPEYFWSLTPLPHTSLQETA